MLVAVAVELGHALEQVPEKEQTAHLGAAVDAEQLEQSGDVEVTDLQLVGDPVEQGRPTVLQERGHLGVDGAQDDEPTPHRVGLLRQPVHLRLEMRGELGDVLAGEVLELVERHHVALLGEVADQCGQLP